MPATEPQHPPRRATRWWFAPARFTAASLALLRKAGLRRELESSGGNVWVRQSPVGIRAVSAGHGAGA